MAIKWIIQDWTGNTMFNGKTFPSFEDGDDFLGESIYSRIGEDCTDEQYSTERGEFDVIEVQS